MSPTAAIGSEPHTLSRDVGRATETGPELAGRAAQALADGLESLMGKLRTDRAPAGAPDGLHWCAELEGDSILSSEYLLMKLILGQEHEDRPRLMRIVNHMRLVQRADGSWGQYPGSPPDVSACVKAYFALKCFGDSPEAPHMRTARERIIELGGAEKCNTFSTFYLACLGAVSWDACPVIPPEIALLPRWFPFHMDKVAAWTRTMILPLAICSALRPVRKLPESMLIDELFVDPTCKTRLNQPWNRDEPVGWKNFFLACDRFLKVVSPKPREDGQRGGGRGRAEGAGGDVLHGLPAWRRRGIRAAEAWIVDRVRPETTEGLGAIFPPMVYLQIAFKALGYPRSHPLIQKAERDLDDFMIDEPNPDPRLDHVRLQPCFSPVWDTGIALYAATEAGLTAAADPRIARVCDWLTARQVRMTGDWVRNLRPEDRGIRLGADACAWAFEYHNDWYPDVDDTAMVAKAMMRAAGNEAAAGRGAGKYAATARKAARWILAMQNEDGGWAAFDKTKDRPWMEAIPFADHNAMQDPSCSDITGRVIESLVTCGLPREHPGIARGVEYLLRTQQPEGCWWGRWGCNYIYGTWQALGGMTYAGVARNHPAMRRAIEWVKSVQNADGGFGESANSYLDRSLMGIGPSTASQTAWGLACLLYFVGDEREDGSLAITDPAIERAAAWLCDHQLCEDKAPFDASRCTGVDTFTPDSESLAPTDFVHDRAGGWCEHHFTGTGFPKVFYLRYNLYRHYFPVMSLARYVRLARAGV